MSFTYELGDVVRMKHDPLEILFVVVCRRVLDIGGAVYNIRRLEDKSMGLTCVGEDELVGYKVLLKTRKQLNVDI